MREASSEKTKVLGSIGRLSEIARYVSVCTMDEALEIIDNGMREDSGTLHIITLNTEMAMAMAMSNNSVALEALYKAGAVTADSIGVIWALRMFHLRQLRGNLIMRVTGVDLVTKIFQKYMSEPTVTFFLLGAEDAVRNEVVNVLARSFNIKEERVGHCGGIYGRDDEKMITTIESFAPTVLILAASTLVGEVWIGQNIPRLSSFCRVAVNTGQTLDVMAGKVVRAPETWQRFGVEWLWRLVHEPWRIRRQSVLPFFVVQLLREVALSRIKERRTR